jgi:hypothetical protein
MESHVASSKIHLLKALEFSGSRVAPYIVARFQITTHNSGSSLYGSGATGSRVCRFEINTSVGAMLDLTTRVVAGQVHNLSLVPFDAAGVPVPGKPLRILSPSLSGLLSSARITVGGVEVSSCNYIARTEHMLSLMQTDAVRRTDFAQRFGLDDPVSGAPYGSYRSKSIAAGQSTEMHCGLSTS